MATGKDEAVGRQLRALFNVGAIGDLTDLQLLERFATGRGEGAELAFAALVERHGPMVLRVARGVLDDPHDAHDAFQATFLVLVAKARGLWVRDSIGPWLHQVAYRTAACQRANQARRRRLERRAAWTEEADSSRPLDDRARVLLEEVARLPERYRAAVVLCDLEGRTHEQAARALGWPVGTVKSRQARARERLRDRLTRRGVAPGLAPPLGGPAPGGLPPAALVNATTLAAVRSFASRAIAPGPASAAAREVIRTMTILRWTQAAGAIVALGVAASGAGLVAGGLGQNPAGPPKPDAKAQAPSPTQSPAPAPAPIADRSVVEVKPGKLRFTIDERGSLEASINRDVLCEVEGNTTIVMIKPEGSVVKKGEVVAELDSATLRDLLVNQRIATQQAEAGYKQARLVREVAEFAVKEYAEGILPQDRASLAGKVDLARQGAELGRARLERARLARQRFNEASNRRSGPETPADVVADLSLDNLGDQAAIDIRGAELELQQARGRLDLLVKYAAEKATRQLTVDVEKAASAEQLKRSSWELEKSKETKFGRQIERCTLVAPGDGILVYANDPGRAGRSRVQIEEGATVRERQKIFSVPDLSAPMRVIARVGEPMVDQVKPGQAVQVVVEAARNETLTGVVRSVAPMADATATPGGPKVYTTFVQLDASPASRDLRPGMSARVEILLDEIDGVLAVPIESLLAAKPPGDQYYVAVKTPAGKKEHRAVTLGRSNGEVVQVKAGLEPGDLVVLKPWEDPTLIRDDCVPVNQPRATPRRPLAR